jgi:hypothetical protein
MTNLRRLKSDISTIDKREMADKVKSDNRDRNDALTQERRFEADATLKKNRERNDEITADRRVTKDWANQDMALAISLFLLIILAVGIFFIFI